jgi:uncharacterized lipoprotein YmbA
MNRRAVRLIAAAGLALAGSLLTLACSVKVPPRQVWTLVARAPGAAPSALGTGPALGVTRFTAMADLRTTDLQYREAGGHLIHQTDDQWADYPDRMIEELALDALSRSGAFSKVAPAPPREGLDAILSTRLVEFSEWHDGAAMETRVALRWTLSDAKGAALATGTASASAPVAERSLQAVVDAYASAANDAIDQLVADVRTSR